MEVYAGLLAAVLEDDMITPEEHDRLGAYRAKHAISQAQHNGALEELGWSLSMYSSKLLQGSELDAYTHVLHRILEDDRVDPEEEERLDAYRTRHGVTQAMHRVALETLGLTEQAFVDKFVTATPGALAEYRELIGRSLQDEHLSEVDELQLLEYRGQHHVTEAQHAATLQEKGLTVAQFDLRRADVLGTQLAQVQARTAEKQRALKAVAAQLAVLQEQEEKQLLQLASSSADAQREATLRTELEGSEEALVGLREQMRGRNAKLRTTQELLDEREAEVYELEEQVRAEEARVAAREAELEAMGEELATVETRVGAAQRQLARLEASANDPEGAGSTLVLRGEEEGEEGEEGEGDSWLQGALLRRSEAARRVQADFVCFHTVCMGLKLGMSANERKASAGGDDATQVRSGAPQMRNVTIDELWAEAQQAKVMPAEYRAFIRARLVQPSTPLAHKLPVAEEVMGRLTQLGGEIGGGLRTLGEGLGNGVVFERVANALKDMAHPAIDGARALVPGGDAGVRN